MQNINYSGQYYNNHNYNIKIRTGEDILNATGDAICGEFMIATGGANPGLYVATKTSGDDFEIYRVSEISSANKLPLPPITNTYSVGFDGIDDTITIPQGTFDLGSGNWTLSMWVRPTNISTTYQNLLMIEGTSAAGSERLGFFINSSNFNVSDWFNTNITYSTTISNNTWYHLLAVKNGNGATDIHLYFNGTKVQEGEHPYSSSYGTDSRDATLGDTGIPGSSAPFEGQIDEFGFWNSALSASDISSIYNSGTPADITSLSPVGWWRMGDNNAGAGTTITDQGSGGNDGTLVNGPTFSTNVPS